MPQLLPRPLREASRPRLNWLLVLLTGLLPYLGALDGEFVAGDIDFITENPVMKSASLLHDAFAHSYWYVGSGADHAPYYRPLIVLLDGANYAAFGERPFGYHLTNLVLHLGASLTALVLGRQLLASQRAALIAATIFAVHPVHTHAVAYISGRTSVLSTLWLLLSLCFAIEAGRRKTQGSGERAWTESALALSFAALAYLSKESSALLPLLAGGAVLVHAPDPKAALRKQAPMLGMLFALLLVYLVARGAALGHLGATRQPLWHRLDGFAALLTMAKIVGFYPAKLLVPIGLSYLPPFVPALTNADPLGVFWLAAIFACALWIVRPSGGQRIWRFWLFWFLATLLPVCGLLPLEYFVKEHHAYLPAVGFCMLLGLVADHGFGWLEAQNIRMGARFGWALLFVCLAMLGAATATHAQSFASSRALFERIIQLEPEISEHAFMHPAMNKSAHRFATARLNLALLELKRGRCERALSHLERVSLLARSDALRFQARFLRGDCQRRLGHLDAAKGEFESALRLDPRRFEPAVELARIAHQQKNAADEQRYLALACQRGEKRACR